MSAYAGLVFELAALLLAGRILHVHTEAGVVTAGRGLIVDWREVKSGEVVVTTLDPYDTAVVLVDIVGCTAADAALGGKDDLEGQEGNVGASS